MQTRILAIKKIIVKPTGRGGQRVANCTHCKNSLPCLVVPPNQLVESCVSPAKGSSTLGGEILRVHPVDWSFLFFKGPTNVYFKERKEGTVERKCPFGDLFLYRKRWFSHMNENETFCAEKQSIVCWGRLAAFSRVMVLFCEKSVFLLLSVQSNSEISCFWSN